MRVPLIWRSLVNEINGGRIPDGEPGIRDVDAPCEAFEPAGAPWQIADGSGTCQTDGHHMCVECNHIDLATLRHRRDQCGDCGAPLVNVNASGEACSARCDLPAVPT